MNQIVIQEHVHSPCWNCVIQHSRWLLLAFYFVFSLPLMSQPSEIDVWYQTQEGNNFDGIKLTAGVVTQADDELFLFKVNNTSGSLSTMDESSTSIENLYFELRGSIDFFPHEILMSFDNSKQVWEATRFISSSPDMNGWRTLQWLNFISRDSNQMMSAYEFVRALKAGATIHFRIQNTNGTKQDVSFPLNGSAVAINRCVTVPKNTSANSEWQEYSIDYFTELTRWALMKPEEISAEKFSRLFEVLKAKYGEFYFFRVGSITDNYGNGIKLMNHRGEPLFILTNDQLIN